MHVQCFVWPFLVQLLAEVVQLALLRAAAPRLGPSRSAFSVR